MGKKKVLVSYGVDIDAVSLAMRQTLKFSDNKAGSRLARIIWGGGLDKRYQQRSLGRHSWYTAVAEAFR